MRIIHLGDFSTKKGFTLVELAIVITIIGLLIGGVLKGQEMIQNARVTNTIAQVQGYTAAVYAFRDKFDQFPGDFSVARTRLPGCSDTTYCVNGNGNSLINRLSNPVDGVAWNTVIATSADWVEATQFWKHLALADLISGVDPGTDWQSPVWGKTHPSSSFGGGFEFYTDTYTTIQQTGHMLRLSNNGISGGPVEAVDQGPALNGKNAALIDRKMDDGKPGTGYVFANYGTTTDACKLADGSGGGYQATIYSETDPRKTCVLFWHFK